jgi:hypothetical protein
MLHIYTAAATTVAAAAAVSLTPPACNLTQALIALAFTLRCNNTLFNVLQALPYGAHHCVGFKADAGSESRSRMQSMNEAVVTDYSVHSIRRLRIALAGKVARKKVSCCNYNHYELLL